MSIRGPDPSGRTRDRAQYREVLDAGMFTTAWRDFGELCATSAVRRRGASGRDRPMDDALAQRLGTAFHPSSSCAIGAVVDAELAVLGVDRLSVDQQPSVFPANTTNNPNLDVPDGRRPSGSSSSPTGSDADRELSGGGELGGERRMRSINQRKKETDDG